MAARISASAVDFAAVASKIPAQQKNAFAALRGKVEVIYKCSKRFMLLMLNLQGHMRVVNSLPASLPAIDFAAYSKVIAYYIA